MGNSKYLDSLNAEQYKNLKIKLWNMQNHKCFICEKEIDIELNDTDVDHIKPIANKGKDNEDNFAITHSHCNRVKQDNDLVVAKKIMKLENILKEAEANCENASLKHILNHYNGSKFKFKYKIENDYLVYSFDDIGDNTIRKSMIYTDKLSGEKDSFVEVPIEYLYHDDEINPRGLNKSVSLLIKEFYKTNPQLQISLARIDDSGKILLFDGQHKTAAQILLDNRRIIIRLFINANYDRLILTNLNAGKQLKQIAFDKAIVRQLHNSMYAAKIKQYQQDKNLSEDDYSFSEQDLANYFRGDKGGFKLYIINSQKHTIKDSNDNILTQRYCSDGRDSTLPMSYSSFEKTILTTFINPKTILSTPINDKLEEGKNPRALEKEQCIKLCNIIAETLLVNKYDFKIGTYRLENKIASGDDSIPDNHLIACRLFKEEIMNNWVKCIEKLIKHHFIYLGIVFDDENLLQQELPEALFENIKTFLINLRDLPVWKNRSLVSTLFGAKNNYDYWKTIFQTGKTPDGTEVLAKPINITEMIRKDN